MPRGTVPQIVRRPRQSTNTPLRMLKRPISVWKHLYILSQHGFAEDSILLYEITNQSTSSNRWIVPDNEQDFATYQKIAEFYEKTKRYAQAGAILKSIIQTFRNERPFSYPSCSTYMPQDDRREDTDEELKLKDYTWFCYYSILQKSNKLKEAYEALKHIRGPQMKSRRDVEIPRLVRRIKNQEESDLLVPETWKADLPDENSARICSSSLGPVLSLLKKNKADSTLVKRFSEQFTGTERNDVYWWLKSAEAVGNYRIYDAIACLKRMSHQNPRVLTEMARLNYQIDKKDEARRLLRTAHNNDSLWIDGMDLLAFLCIGDFTQHAALIENLATTLNREWPHRAETCTVNGFMAQQIDTELAWSFAERARKMVFPGTEQYVFAVHLRAYVLRTMELKSRGADVERYRNQAHRILLEAVESMPNNTDLGVLYVDTLLEDEDSGHREAKIFATRFLHDNQNNVQAKLLKVHVLVNGVSRNPDANHTKELFQLLEDVITEHPHILAAYCFLLNEYARLKNSDKCNEILEKLTAARPLISQGKTHKFHKMKADYLLKTRDVIPAYEHLMAAFATGAMVDQAMIANYESEFLSTKAVAGDYGNLAFLDPILPERPCSSITTVQQSPSALQEVVNVHENAQDSSEGEDEEDEEEEEEMLVAVAP
ncbi:TPR-like protein [Caenorhabditis elegans]|uniref:TPR-like protein n=1 Tax=Caenorhabditis elegans TaxID=6239 RepID=Q8WSN7_CAEEL|nr:TPR-like protein [Caenorhabditis elegans]CCD66726.1 TPR-like protein [Caenorhabditis elegans]|eukprot:NP_500116.4 Uncharacterized protein CELE_Y41D4B.4 [Caenorhabditis elegans]